MIENKIESNLKWLPDDFSTNLTESYIRPFHTFLVKIATLCNLNCDYCYVYQMPDQSYKLKPKKLELDVADKISEKINEHVISNSLNDITIIFHGGEPLLVGHKHFLDLVNIFNKNIKCKINWGLQTNGVLVDEQFINIFQKHEFSLGVSIDGYKESNDIHRLYHNGKSSFDDTLKCIKLLNHHSNSGKMFGGILAVIDLDVPPKELLDFVVEYSIKSVNPILPDGHNSALPPNKKSLTDIRYGRWLSELFELWYHDYNMKSIPYFEEIIGLMLGGESGAEEIGAKSVDLVVVETNGDLEAVDTLKVVGREATSLKMNVFEHSFDEALKHPAIYSRMVGFKALSEECQNCIFLNNCGGGYIPHRYSVEKGFINTSVYCNDLKFLFQTIEKTIFKK